MTTRSKRTGFALTRRRFMLAASAGAGVLVASPAIIARAQNAKLLKFGDIQALTGPSAAYGIRARDGARMAIDEINATGGFQDSKGNTWRLEVEVADMANDPKQAVTLLRQFSTRAEIAVVTGPTNSVGFIAMVPVAAQLGIVVLNNGSGAPVKKPSEWVYRVNPVSTVSVPVLLRKVHEKVKFKRLAVIYDQTQDAQAGDADVCRKEKAALGYEIVADEAFRAGDQDFSAQISKIKAAKPDAIYVAGATGDGIKVTSQIRGAGLEQPLLTGFGSFQDPVYWDGTNGAVKGGYTWLAQDLASASGRLKDWLERYKQRKFELEATSFSTYGYDGVYTLVEAVKKAGSIDRKAIRDAMAHLEFRSPIDTTVKFDNPPTGDNLQPTVNVLQITGRGTYVAV